MRAWPLVALLFACGEDLRLRPLVLDVQGLSSRAERLVVMLFPSSTGQTCVGLDLTNVETLAAPIVAEWNRAEGTERSFELPAVEERSVTIVAYSQDAQGMPIQFGCTEIDYVDIESPEASLRLSMRMVSRAVIVPACRSSGPSSSSECSVAVEWRRRSSASARATRAIARSS
jgi:hypothetical protein